MIDVQRQIERAIWFIEQANVMLRDLDGVEQYVAQLDSTVVDLQAELTELNSMESK